MLLDKQNLMAEDQAITATAASTNIIDLGALGTTWQGGTPPVPNKKGGEALRILVQVTADFATCTSIQAVVQTDSVEAFSSPATVLSGAAVAVADAVAGAHLLEVQLPRAVAERYVRINFVVVGDAATAGTVTAGLTMDQQNNL